MHLDKSDNTLVYFIRLCSAMLLVAALFSGRNILMPLAMAGLLAFLLNPLVVLVTKLRLPRSVAVVIVTALVFSLLGLIGYFVGKELHGLAGELPSHRHNIQNRITEFQHVGQGGVLERLRKLIGDVSNTALRAGAGDAPAPARSPQTNAPEAAPAPAPAPPSDEPGSGGLVSKFLNSTLTNFADALGTLSVVILFVIFLLLRQKDISQRITRLAGYSRLTITTKAMDEIGTRISRYLTMQGMVNAIYGAMLALGLMLIGLPYVILWGVLAAMFRFIPYVGPILVAVLPIGLSLAVFDGWTQPLMVIGFIIVLELVTNMILEPVLYGQSVGVSDFSLLVAITFWTWLWGGVGLVLATPLTVCIVVFCKYIPTLEWVDILMGDKLQPLPHLTYYQQLLADHQDAAELTLLESFGKDGLDLTLENIALPALALTRREVVLKKLDSDDEALIYQNMRNSLTTLREERETAETKAATKEAQQVTGPPASNLEHTAAKVSVFGRALHGEADAQSLSLLAELLPANVSLEISLEPTLTGEIVRALEENPPALICISAMPPGAELAAKRLCRRIRSRLPQAKILVCRWGLPGQDLDPKPLLESGASWVVTTLKEAQEIITGINP